MVFSPSIIIFVSDEVMFSSLIIFLISSVISLKFELFVIILILHFLFNKSSELHDFKHSFVYIS